MQSQLELARRQHIACDLPFIWIADSAVRCSGVLYVENVESLCSEGENSRFSKMDALEKGEIRVRNVRRPEEVPWSIAVREGGNSECSRIKPLVLVRLRVFYAEPIATSGICRLRPGVMDQILACT